MANAFRSSVSHYVTAGLTAIGLAGAVYAAVTDTSALIPSFAKIFMIFWLGLSIILSLVVVPRNFVIGFLSGLAAMLIGWRIAGIYGVGLVTYPLLAAFLAFSAQFIDCIRRDYRSPEPKLTLPEWQLTFLRIYIGFDLVPHFTEKLFAGIPSFEADVSKFAGFGMSSPDMFVLVGGLCEFGIMVGFGLGLFTRLAGLCATLYFLIATIIGGHFLNGFIWASSGGGWEYSALTMAVFMSYVLLGSGRFSFDGELIATGRLPAILMPLCRSRR